MKSGTCQETAWKVVEQCVCVCVCVCVCLINVSSQYVGAYVIIFL